MRALDDFYRASQETGVTESEEGNNNDDPPIDL
jgi:hypothetical protein